MFTVSNLLRTHKGRLTGIDIRIDGSGCAGAGVRTNGTAAYSILNGKSRILKAAKKYGVRRWEAGNTISITCGSSAAASGHLTVANLCRTCANKDIFVSINGAEKKHIYSVHPVKDSKTVRRWWIDGDRILHIQTWPWKAK